jgi:hypothetical protein
MDGMMVRKRHKPEDICVLYAVEADTHGWVADERRTVRQERSRPLIE